MYAAFHILIIITELIQIMYKLQELLESCKKKEKEGEKEEDHTKMTKESKEAWAEECRQASSWE